MLKEILAAIVRLRAINVDIYSDKALVASTDYAAEDVLSDSASLGTVFRFQNCARKNGGGGVIEKAIAFLSVTALTPRITLYLYKNEPAGLTLNDNAANTGPNLANIPNCVGWVDFLAMEDLSAGGSLSIATVGTPGNLPMRYSCITRDLYGIAVLRDAVTGESAGMRLAFLLSVVQD